MRTPDEIFAEIKDIQALTKDRDFVDSPEYWITVADDQDRVRDLWRELGAAAEPTQSGAPGWAVVAAFWAADHASDVAERYRQFARDVARRADQVSS